jgi:hypothetical protein
MSGHEQRPGDWRCICDFSGFKCWASETVKTHDGFRVLKRFAGEETQRHPQELVRGRPDNQRVAWARPEPTDTFLSPGDVTPSDL